MKISAEIWMTQKYCKALRRIRKLERFTFVYRSNSEVLKIWIGGLRLKSLLCRQFMPDPSVLYIHLSISRQRWYLGRLRLIPTWEPLGGALDCLSSSWWDVGPTVGRKSHSGSTHRPVDIPTHTPERYHPLPHHGDTTLTEAKLVPAVLWKSSC